MRSSVIFRGQSGALYRFHIWPLGTAFKAISGVYVVSKRTSDDRTFSDKGSHRPVMIGQMEDLSALVFSQANLKAFAAAGAEYLCVCAVSDAEERQSIEHDLVEAHSEASGSRHLLLEPIVPQAKPGPPFKTES